MLNRQQCIYLLVSLSYDDDDDDDPELIFVMCVCRWLVIVTAACDEIGSYRQCIFL